MTTHLPSLEVIFVLWIRSISTESVHVKHHCGKWSEAFDTVNHSASIRIFCVVKLLNPFTRSSALNLVSLEQSICACNKRQLESFLKSVVIL